MQQHYLDESGPFVIRDRLPKTLVGADAVKEQRLVSLDERGPAHHFDAAGDDDVTATHADRVGGAVERVLTRAAGTVDGDAGNLLGPPGREHDEARDVAGLIAELGDASGF